MGSQLVSKLPAWVLKTPPGLPCRPGFRRAWLACRLSRPRWSRNHPGPPCRTAGRLNQKSIKRETRKKEKCFTFLRLQASTVIVIFFSVLGKSGHGFDVNSDKHRNPTLDIPWTWLKTYRAYQYPFGLTQNISNISISVGLDSKYIEHFNIHYPLDLTNKHSKTQAQSGQLQSNWIFYYFFICMQLCCLHFLLLSMGLIEIRATII